MKLALWWHYSYTFVLILAGWRHVARVTAFSPTTRRTTLRRIGTASLSSNNNAADQVRRGHCWSGFGWFGGCPCLDGSRIFGTRLGTTPSLCAGGQCHFCAPVCLAFAKGHFGKHGTKFARHGYRCAYHVDAVHYQWQNNMIADKFDGAQEKLGAPPPLWC